MKRKKRKIKIKNSIKKLFTKRNIFNIIVIIIDISLTIYFARHNVANYVKITEKTTKFIGKTRNLLFGRNYINLITTAFFFLYICISNKYLFQKKITKKFLISTLIILLILNITLFLIFTKKVY